VQAISGWVPAAAGYARAREAALRAIELDPNLADGYAALGHVLEACDWNWSGAKAEYQHALALDPGNVRTLNLSGHVALDEGRLEDAAHFYHKAIISDPLSPAAHAGLAAALWASGRLAEAEAAFRQLVSLVSNDSAGWLGVLMVERGQEAGLEQINRDTNESIRLVTLSMANYRLGRRVESDQALAELIKKYADSPCRIAQALAYRGESDAAFRWLETAYAAHDKDLMWIKIHAGLRGLPRDARFASLLRRMNLPE
jgi:tetratricopeptide (TPR) repeat protein